MYHLCKIKIPVGAYIDEEWNWVDGITAVFKDMRNTGYCNIIIPKHLLVKNGIDSKYSDELTFPKTYIEVLDVL